MSHKSKGYFYYEYIYETEWEGGDPNLNNQGKDESTRPPFRTAYYSESRQDHKAQTDWYKNRARPAIEADCKKIIDKYNGTNIEQYAKEAADRQPNRFKRTMKPFDWACVKEQKFMWTESLPTTAEGSQKGQPYGREL
ncbi:hypothetical protein F5Y02DRAFT_413577 [Annulohypoxylon stygium]|nr:hypothetical protein F5Y02DRAFT_413577 [Annulohypoxylon stygium]